MLQELSIDTIAVRELQIPARDGHPLAASLYEPRGRRSGTVIINSATAVSRRYYKGFASYLAERGFRVVTYDYRGVGESKPETLRGFEASMTEWGTLDFAGVLDYADEWAREGEPIYVVGHSVGGQIIGLAPNNARIDAIVGVGAQSGDLRLWPLATRTMLGLKMRALFPITATFGYLPESFLGEALPRGVADQWAGWALTPGYFFGTSDAPREGFERVTAPILAITIDDDDLAPDAAVCALASAYTNARVWRRTIRPEDHRAKKIGHFGLFKSRFRSSLWREIGLWLDARTTDKGMDADAPKRAA